MNEAFLLLSYWHGGCSLVITTRYCDLGKKTSIIACLWRGFMIHKRDMYLLDRIICKEASAVVGSPQ